MQFLSYKDELIKSLIDMLNIPSFNIDATTEYPFGENIDKALNKILDTSCSLGLNATYKDGYYGFADYGEGEDLLAILGHIDVVPFGNLDEWTLSPYTPGFIENKLIGRGVMDNKGPLIICLYALKSLLDEGFTPSKRIRFIFGTDEERSWKGMKKYAEAEEIPTLGFTPDSAFPLVNAEKGLYQFRLFCNRKNEFNMSGGSAANSVPALASVIINNKTSELESSLNYLGYEYSGQDNRITILGKAAHAAVPETGINAVNRLCKALYKSDIHSALVDFIAEQYDDECLTYNPLKNVQDEKSGNLTSNVGIINIDDDSESVIMDMRLPVTVSIESIEKSIIETAEKYGLEYERTHYLEALYVNTDTELVRKLQDSFNKITGLNLGPQTCGGGTYARAFKNCVAYGPGMPHMEDVGHKPNEYIKLKDIELLFDIYKDAIYELSK
ncbi:MAG TPA: Sapep family Mn(2+)-dependent dipeptidase [Victivallales bacterium]|nr:Sapep family Mn(2+)-dependent dipeptidase [Victivallales bacterium]